MTEDKIDKVKKYLVPDINVQRQKVINFCKDFINKSVAALMERSGYRIEQNEDGDYNVYQRYLRFPEKYWWLIMIITAIVSPILVELIKQELPKNSTPKQQPTQQMLDTTKKY